MANESQILPLVVGAINDDEQHSTIYVNCQPGTDKDDITDVQKTALNNLEGKVLFPTAAKGDVGTSDTAVPVPIIGGSIVKITSAGGLNTRTSEADDATTTTKYTGASTRLNKYRTGKLSGFLSSIQGIDPEKKHPRIDKLVNTRLKINKSLEAMPSISSEWHGRHNNVPTLVLSRMLSDSITDASGLQAEIDPLLSDNIRKTGIKTVGTFKFIPIQVIKRMLNALIVKDVDEEASGLKNYVGISGKTFGELAEYLENEKGDPGLIFTKDTIDSWGDLDEKIVQILLDLFPIHHVHEDFIIGEDYSNDIGYFTAVGDSLYIKMPDLSGRDSSGFSSNIYGLGDDDEKPDRITFCFELLLSTTGSYGALAFDSKPPPAVELVEGDMTFPEGESGGEIVISKEGLDYDNKITAKNEYRFFLSPIITPKKSIKAKGFADTEDAVEIFTAPVLTKPYFDPDETDTTKQKPTVDLENAGIKDDIGTIYENLVEYIQKNINLFDKDVTSKLDNETTTFLKQSFVDLGLPLSVPLTKVGASRPSDVLGEINRPEILIGFRDGKPADEDNDTKFFNYKTASARDIVVSNRPNILTGIDDQIPKLWIELEKKTADEDKGQDPDTEWILKVKDSKDLIANYNSTAVLKFALYAVDDLGQIVRVPGENIEIYPKSVSLTDISPNGFLGDKITISVAGQLFGPTALSLSVSGGTDVTKICFYTDEAMENLVACIKDKDEVGGYELRITTSDEKVKVYMRGLVSDLLGHNIGTYYVNVCYEDGTCSGPQEFYVAADGTNSSDLPLEKGIRVKFDKDESQLSVSKFGGGNVHSVPILMDGQSAQIKIKSKEQKIFGQGVEMYAYIAISAHDDNLKILKEDVGWTDDGEGVVEVSLDKPFGTYWVPTSLEYELNTSDFKSSNEKTAVLKFPGTSNSMVNMSRFTELKAKSADQYPAYIILTNKQITPGMDRNALNAEVGMYSVLPMGTMGDTTGLADDRPFITPPYIMGFITELPSEGGKPRVESNIKQSSLSLIKKGIKKIDIGEVKAEKKQNFQLVTSDGLDRLAVVFSAPNQAKMWRMYSGSIGNTKLKSYMIGGYKHIKADGQNLVIANYKNIKNVKDEGWVDISITKKDKYFNVTYDSTLYNRTTVTFSDDQSIDHGTREKGWKDLETGSPTKKSGDIDVLATDMVDLGGDAAGRPIPLANNLFDDLMGFHDYSKDASTIFSMSSVIFPGGNGAFTPLPLVPHESYTTGVVTDDSAYYRFANPIKLYPTVDLIFGKFVADTGRIDGISLSDSPIDDEGLPGVEVIGISTNGQTSAIVGLAALVEAAIERAKAAAQAMKDMAAQVAELKNLAEQFPDEYGEAYAEALKQQETATKNYAAAEEEASGALSTAENTDAAMDAARSDDIAGESSGSGVAAAADDAGEALASTAENAKAAAEAALAALDAALSALNAITDALSRIGQLANAILEGVEAAINSMGSRPSDFHKASIKHVYIDKKAAISTSSIINNKDEDEFKMVIGFRFAQTSAIRFNTPEIIEARRGDEAPYLAYGDNIFSKMIVTTGDNILLKTIGATKDTKFEISGKRVKHKQGTPFTKGIFMNFEVTIPDMSSFSIFGTNECLSISMTNSQENRMRLRRQMDNDIALNLDDKWPDNIFGGGRGKQGPVGKFSDAIEMFFLKFTSVTLDKSQGAKEVMQSFCDFSFHLTAELSLQLRNFKVLLIPIKIIFCIIDVICALLHPVRLAFAIIRLFLCLYDLILLLPQLSVPAMHLALLLHLLELLLCVILKILSIINAINEIITALATAIEDKNYPAMVALEEALNEHLFSLEADLSVLEPIITIIALFLELLQLIFVFPCQIGADEDDEACIDPSQLAGIIISKVAPFGKIEPDALLPIAQAYTTLPLANVASKGNTPPPNVDPDGIVEDEGFVLGDYAGNSPSELTNIFRTPAEAVDEGFDVVVSEPSEGGTILPGLVDSMTGENKEVQGPENGLPGGYFSDIAEYAPGDQIINVDYRHLRFNGPDRNDDEDPTDHTSSSGETVTVDSQGNFQATFGLSYTKTKKDFAILTGPDPRIVNFEFKGRGETHALAFGFWLIAIFFRKKNIDILQTCDSMPSFLMVDEDDQLRIANDDVDTDELDFISPIDGFGAAGESFIEYSGVDDDGFTVFTPKPLSVEIELQEPGIDPVTLDAIFTPVTVQKTFGNIPMIALVDHEFNVYFIEEDGIKAIKEDGVWKIESIVAKMINHPSAPKHRLAKEDREVFTWDLMSDYDVSISASTGISEDDINDLIGTDNEGVLGTVIVPGLNNGSDFVVDVSDPDEFEAEGSIVVKQQANANAIGGILSGLTWKTSPSEGQGQKVQHPGGDDIKDSKNSESGDCEGDKVYGEGYSPEGRDMGLGKISWDDIKDYLLGTASLGTLTWVNEVSHCTEFIIASWMSETKIDMEHTFPAGTQGTDNGFTIDDIPFPGYGAKDWAYGEKDEQKALQDALDTVKVFDFPRAYIVDVRQCADDIAAACSASGPMELLLDLPGVAPLSGADPDPDLDADGKDKDSIAEQAIEPVEECLKAFLAHFHSTEEDDDGKPTGIIPKLRYELSQGMVEDENGDMVLAPTRVPIPHIIDRYKTLVECIEDSIGKTCRFVLNPLNTTFKLLGDDDETPLTEYINPEQKDLKTLMKFDIIDEIELTDEMSGFPKITGAMEYASGIGDLVVAEAESKVYIQIIPRDCYDEPLPTTLDLSDEIRIDFITDETGSAALVEVADGEESLVVKDDTTYMLAVSTDVPGKVVIKATICSVLIQAVTDAGIIDTRSDGISDATSDVDCIEDADSSDDDDAASLLAPGELMKVDRTLTILFVPKGSLTGSGGASGRYGDDDREESARSAKPGPQTFGTKLEN